jgi:hypothetical protein
VRERFRELAGECGHLDVSIFSFGSTAVMYLQDAITALGILDVDPSGWHAKDGYPAFYFDAERVCEFSQRLAACGYAVRVLEPANPSGRIGARAARAEVIDIASARRRINAL